MQTGTLNIKLRQIITLGLTVVGLILFVFGGSKAMSQSNDKQYVEGKQREQQLRASQLAALENGVSNGLENIMNPLFQAEASKAVEPDNDAKKQLIQSTQPQKEEKPQLKHEDSAAKYKSNAIQLKERR